MPVGRIYWDHQRVSRSRRERARSAATAPAAPWPVPPPYPAARSASWPSPSYPSYPTYPAPGPWPGPAGPVAGQSGSEHASAAASQSQTSFPAPPPWVVPPAPAPFPTSGDQPPTPGPWPTVDTRARSSDGVDELLNGAATTNHALVERAAAAQALAAGALAGSPPPLIKGQRAPMLDRHGNPIPKMTRRRDGRVISGVSAGIADHLKVPVIWVRVTFCLFALLTGVGVFAYALFWIFIPQAESSSPQRTSSTERRQAIGIATLGVALAVVGASLGLGQSLAWIIGPLGLAAVGGAFIWREADDAQRQRWRRSAVGVVGDGSGALWRIVGGAVLVVGGLAVFALGQFNFNAAGGAMLAVVLTLFGVAIIAVPWWLRLVRDLGSERRQLVAQQERAEIAAHLHDSVLQTLALIQRQAADPREVLRLSRSQERELRSWLYGPAGYASAASVDPSIQTVTVAVALAAAAGEVEDTYAVKVTPVVVGDTPMDSDMTALVAAAREAMVNAAKHAGNPDISVYAEVEDDAVTVFVRDRGVGFDPTQVGADRRGLAESIRGRMDRHRGRAVVRSTPGEGTEVELQMPISAKTGEFVEPNALGAPAVPAESQHP
jgi:signal transduction histidine kinase